MNNFTKLRAYLNRIAEVAEEDSSSAVSLGVTPAVQEAIKELDRLEQQIELKNEKREQLVVEAISDLSRLINLLEAALYDEGEFIENLKIKLVGNAGRSMELAIGVRSLLGKAIAEE